MGKTKSEKASSTGTSCGERYCLKKGDKSELIREINIRLAGFGGNVPTDEFTDRTEKMIKQFQRDYIKVPETGKFCGNVLRAIDDFSIKFDIGTTFWNQLKCSCKTKGQETTSKLRKIKEKNKCNDFGDHTGKGTYKDTPHVEANHNYEYPGIHRSKLTIWNKGVKILF
ncbi:peptidoglycan-binding protein [Flavobacterium davisii]|uniref:peptidoglycan-binding domain-containing protein n=1 Tax=Flavobacterium davisii TaxID=2906077 RepID=UPI0035D092B8